MIHVLCLVVSAVVGAICLMQIRATRRELEQLQRRVAADGAVTLGQLKFLRERINLLRLSSGEEIAAISERLSVVEFRDTPIDLYKEESCEEKLG